MRITFIAILSMVLFSIFYQLPTYAALERYTWKDYKTIQGESGIYGVIANTGGEPQTSFLQDKGSPTKLGAEDISDTCKGSLLITLKNSDSKADLSSSGECGPFLDADKSITIGGQDVAKTSVENEEKQMTDVYNKDKCDDSNSQISTDCLNENKQKIEDMRTTCLAEHNYKQNVSTGDAYLDCMSEALGVPRPTDKEPEEDDTPDECTLDDTGWIVCQMNLFIANLTDFTFILLKPFLIITPFNQTTGTSLPDPNAPPVDPNNPNPPANNDTSTFTAWKSVRNLANVILVLAFVLIIYSHLTGKGISVYNIKRMFPRLIVAAILINLSFVICSLAIDASNVVGVTLQDVIKKMDRAPESASGEYADWISITKKINSTGATEPKEDPKADPNDPNKTSADTPADTGNSQGGTSAQNDEEDDTSVKLTKLTVGGAEVTGIAVMFIQLSALIPIMVMALFAMLTVLIVLLLRLAIVIVLVVLSPLAFACFLLPNTQRWFDRWREIFVDMMILFPAISLVFGASNLASNVIRKTAEENGEVLLAIFSLGVQVIPLFVAPLLIKLGGGVLNQFAGVVNDKRKGAYDRSMNRAREFRDDRKAVRQMNAARGKTFFGKVPIPGGKDGRLNRMRPINRRAVKQKARDLATAEAENQQHKFNAENADAINNRTLRHINDGAKDVVTEALGGMATTKIEGIELEEVGAAEARFRNDRSISPDAMFEAARTGMLGGKQLSEAEQRAALRIAGEQFNDAADANGVDGIAKANSLVAASGSMSMNMRRELIQTLRQNKVGDKAAYLGGSALGKIERGEVNGQEGINKLVQSAAKGGKFSQQALAGSADTTLNLLNQNMNQLPPEAAAQLKLNASKTLTNPNLSTTLRSTSKGHIERMSR